MASLTLVIMAAGIGHRYGGLKQLESFGPSGEVIMDYSIYDALEAGYDKVVFVIRRDFEGPFRDKVGKRIEQKVDTAYVIQSLDKVPAGFAVPVERLKPWGTGHAILACREAVTTPFTAINADDFYGRSTFEIMSRHLRGQPAGSSAYEYAMIGYRLANTLSEHGHVARGVAEALPDGTLVSIRELLKIQKFPDAIKHTENGVDWIPLDGSSLTSMNFWGFGTSLFAELDSLFRTFLRENSHQIARAEFLIPEIVGGLVRQGKARVRILPTQERWFGVTYPADRPVVQAEIAERVRRGVYPSPLWPAD